MTKRTWASEVRNVSLLVANAVNSEGFREILGICEGAKEDKSGWSATAPTRIKNLKAIDKASGSKVIQYRQPAAGPGNSARRPTVNTTEGAQPSITPWSHCAT